MRFLSRSPITLLFFLVSLAGCGKSLPEFQPNRLIAQRMALENETSMDAVHDDIQAALGEMFGGPDQPKWPSFLESDEFAELHQPVWLDRAAGAVGRAHDKIERGLYRKHCAHCHALNGDGVGPTAYFQNPYPRDFRRGSFKFKSTPIGSKPTFEDLRLTITRGIAGTAMPAFGSGTSLKSDAESQSKSEEEIDALAHYVRYLSIRGEIERRLLLKAGSQINLDKGERLYDPKLRETDSAAFAKSFEWIEGQAREVARSWLIAPEKRIEVVDNPMLDFDFPDDLKSDRKTELLASIDRGRETFRGSTAACSLCHGKNGEGNGSTPDFDEWTKDWTIRAGIDPKVKGAWKVMKPFGALEPLRDPPRNFRHGVFRGGSKAEDIYRRIVGGIEGSPMPSAPIAPAHPQGLTNDQVWDLINFVRSLQYGDAVPENSAVAIDQNSKGGA